VTASEEDTSGIDALAAIPVWCLKFPDLVPSDWWDWLAKTWPPNSGDRPHFPPLPLVTDTRINLSDKSWTHISSNHPELAELDRLEVIMLTLRKPDEILKGKGPEKWAVREIEPGRWVVVVYLEHPPDPFVGTSGSGYVITAFITHQLKSFAKIRVWP
jgi:hypothetical protein